MENYHVIGALLLLFVASSTSQENITDYEDATSPIETVPLTSTGSPSVPLTSTGSPSVPLPSTGSPSVQQQMVETSALPNVTSVSVAMEMSTSKEPTTMSNGVASSTITTEVFKATNELSTPASEFNNQSTTLKTVDMATIPAIDEVDGSESPTDDQSPLTTQNKIDSSDDKEDVTQTGRKKDKEENFSTTNHPGQGANKDRTDQEKDQRQKELVKVILIGVIIFVLILLLATVLFFMLRKKKRSGSFRTNSKKNAKKDVWAGQVPELGDGRAPQGLAMAENGRAGTGLETVKEEEMITFVTGEKKTDSAIEMNELEAGGKATANGGEKLGKGGITEEKTPLLEEAAEESAKQEEQFPVPPVEQ